MAGFRETFERPLGGYAPLAWAATALLLSSPGCITSANEGIDPPTDELSFITGLLLEGGEASGSACSGPSECSDTQACVQGQCQGAAPYIVAANANSNRDYNGSALVVLDLKRFFDATGIDGLGSAGASVSAAGEELTAERPCRRDAAQARVIECEESFFALPDAGVAMGVFAGAPVAMHQKSGERQILVPVRGEPSVTVVDLQGGQGGTPLRLSCASDGEARRCDAEHKLRAVRGDASLGRLPMHPRGIITDPSFDPPLAMMAHDARPELTLIAFEQNRADAAMILDTVPILASGPAGIGNSQDGRSGGSDLALYPCQPRESGGTPPLSTRNCTQPLVYASYRNRARVDLVSVTDLKDMQESKASCVQAKNAGASTFGCGVGARAVEHFDTGSFVPVDGSPADAFGASAFVPDGSYYFLLQRAPGALLRFDSRVDPKTQMPKNSFAGAIDICADASDLLIYSGERNYALVTCRDASQVNLIDLDSFNLIRSISVAANPSAMVADPVREVVYIPSFMNASINVLDMSESRPTRHSIVARLGLLEEID